MNKKLHKVEQKDMRRVAAYADTDAGPCVCTYYVTCSCQSAVVPYNTVYNQIVNANYGKVYQH